MSFIELVRWSIWDLVRPRKLLTVLLVCLVGPLFALLLHSQNVDPAANYGVIAPLAVYSFTLVLLSVVFASSAISSEVVGKTIQFLLTRPIPRWKIVLAKWFAASLVVGAATVGSCILTGLVTHGTNIAQSGIARDSLIILVGAATYCSLFTMLSVLALRPWLLAIAFGFFWESWVPFLGGDFQKLSIMSQLRALTPHVDAPSPEGVGLLRALTPETIQPAAAWNTLAVVTIFALAIAALVFMVSEFVPKEESV